MKILYYNDSFYKKIYNLRNFATHIAVSVFTIGFFTIIAPKSESKFSIFVLCVIGFILFGIFASYCVFRRYVGSNISIEDSQVLWTLANGKQEKIFYSDVLEMKLLGDRIFLIYKEQGSFLKKTFSIFYMDNMSEEEMKGIYNFIMSKNQSLKKD